MPMDTCASAAGGSIFVATAAVAVAKRSVLVCKMCCFVLRWLYTQLGYWVGTEKEKFDRALNYYLRSFQSLKHTYHLRIRLGGGFIWSRKLRKNRRNASVFASEFFRKRNQALGESLATHASPIDGVY